MLDAFFPGSFSFLLKYISERRTPFQSVYVWTHLYLICTFVGALHADLQWHASLPGAFGLFTFCQFFMLTLLHGTTQDSYAVWVGAWNPTPGCEARLRFWFLIPFSPTAWSSWPAFYQLSQQQVFESLFQRQVSPFRTYLHALFSVLGGSETSSVQEGTTWNVCSWFRTAKDLWAQLLLTALALSYVFLYRP